MIVYTCVFGYTDPLHEPLKPHAGVRFICFTDQQIESEHWEIAKVPPVEAPTRTAREYKMSPHLLFKDAPYTLWLDANMQLTEDPVKLPKRPIVCFRHNERTRIVEEAECIARTGKAPTDKVYRQLFHYQDRGFDTDESPIKELSCTGALLRQNCPEINALNDRWRDQLRFTLRDQMSLDYCAWRLGIKIERWPGDLKDSPYFQHHYYRRPVNDY